MKDHDTKGCGPRWGWSRKRSGWGGPHWKQFGPFGAMAGGGPRGGRMFAQGDLRMLLLALIADQPSHGYDLIRTIEQRFNGAYSPSPGTIYPTLTLLEEQDLIAARAEAGSKKSYEATAKGRLYLEENAEQVMALMQRIDMMAKAESPAPLPASVLQAVQTLRHAIMLRSGAMTAQEEARLRDILEKAARDVAAGPDRGS